jgi:hypothetical protein
MRGHVPGRELEVGPADGTGGDADPELAGAGLRSGPLLEPERTVGDGRRLVKDGGSHDVDARSERRNVIRRGG